MTKRFYSTRIGKNQNLHGFEFSDIRDIFRSIYLELEKDGYFAEALGFECVDGDIPGKIRDPSRDMFVNIRKDKLWPIHFASQYYEEDDLFDVIEYLHSVVSKPLKGTYHQHNDCGMHWHEFDKIAGQNEFREKINSLLDLYKNKFELSKEGEVLQRPEDGLERIFNADIPVEDRPIKDRVTAAILRYRRHGSTIDDRRHAVRDLADVLEFIRPKMEGIITKKDESDLFNIANNFGIRHHNEKQKTEYDDAAWLSWIFYLYLSTIHLVMRKLGE
ncbi:hypothetical protein [Methylobacterium indicum]|uniref:Uncharacterized protein n=1 Tax=Methylobacterium indicum TaxID=1775910 RepID=A0A8H8X1F4_9HYPH|nr:hypothetical protein [Methylobacterium indicum]BCM88063.1 hypothetical protein mvi_65240 [Methylobacterium indicum]